MRLPTARDLGEGRMLLDLGFRDHEGLVASYLLPGEEGFTLVETGPTTCREALRAGLVSAGVDPAEVRRVLVTHIHLDHAGGLGAAAAMFPRARLYVHAAGAAHMIDPTRLIESARRAWGPAADPLWGPITAVPAGRLEVLRGGERLPLKGGALEVVATPGHARHHLAFFDERIGALLTGDAAGVHLEGSWRARPAVPPPDLDLEALFASLETMARLAPQRILYSHFGPATGAVEALRDHRRAVEEWRDAALAAAREDPSVPHVARAIREREEAAAASAGGRPADEDRGALVSGYDLAAQGLLRYFRRRGEIPG